MTPMPDPEIQPGDITDDGCLVIDLVYDEDVYLYANIMTFDGNFRRSLNTELPPLGRHSHGWAFDHNRIIHTYNRNAHRDGGPAIIYEDGVSEEWYQHRCLHRHDGPAVTRWDGSQYWYHRGVLVVGDELRRLEHEYSVQTSLT